MLNRQFSLLPDAKLRPEKDLDEPIFSKNVLLLQADAPIHERKFAVEREANSTLKIDRSHTFRSKRFFEKDRAQYYIILINSYL